MMAKKQEQHLERLQVKPLYYYDGVITVCLLRGNTQVLARGVAICSPLDQFIKRIGRAKALGMALLALTHRRASGDIRPFDGNREPSHPIWRAEKFRWRSGYLPTLTDLEQAIVSRVR